MEQDPQLNSVLKDLSDIKRDMAVNTNETSNIKLTVTEIKQTLAGMSSSVVHRTEFQAFQQRLEERRADDRKSVDKLWSIVYWIVGVFALALIGSGLRLVIK